MAELPQSRARSRLQQAGICRHVRQANLFSWPPARSNLAHLVVQRIILPITNLCASPVATPRPSKVACPEKTAILRNQTVPLAGMTEAEVIAKAQLGDEHCFAALYNQHKRRVFSLCLRMTGDHAQAEDFTR